MATLLLWVMNYRVSYICTTQYYHEYYYSTVYTTYFNTEIRITMVRYTRARINHDHHYQQTVISAFSVTEVLD